MRAVIGDPMDLAGQFRLGALNDIATLASNRMASKLELFFDLSASVQLTQQEERTLLDIALADLLRLRLDNTQAAAFGSKLERRIDYAIPVLRRMLAAIAS